jgi:hypothetical protein
VVVAGQRGSSHSLKLGRVVLSRLALSVQLIK